MNVPRTIVSKSKYAELKNRTPSAISNWIAQGKISRAALIGEGYAAKIWVEQADADLARALDPAQQAAQEHPVEATILSLATGRPVAPSIAGAAEDEDLRRRRKADADRAEHEAERARRNLAVDEGRWVDAAEAAKAWAGELAKYRAETETFLTQTLARALAEEPSRDWKVISARIRDLWREHCGRLSTEAGERREQMPAEQTENAAEEAPPE